ncbi:hypothetical protein [Serratia rubidaea]|uniref:hypothetical protein n=1 Tax=Serratia rubidaea TaxID=61652 RepID=UPI0010FD1AB2|nr:hypothetical protein [Serratia rubidaea]QPR62221.1 hypothetical protein I6G83_15475 [Serratia rubidaea]HAY0637105.1 hypothetical protein [Serratia rubidaea]
MAYADGIITPLSIAIVSSENSEMQISTTKGTLYEDNVLICFTEKETCAVYRGSDFSSIMPNDSVEDVATGKKYIHIPFVLLKVINLRRELVWPLYFMATALKLEMLILMITVAL